MPKMTPRGLDVWNDLLDPLHALHKKLHPDVMERIECGELSEANILSSAQDAIHIATKLLDAYRSIPENGKDDTPCTDSTSRNDLPTR